MAKFGKKYLEAAKKVDRSKTYSVAEAVKLAKETNTLNSTLLLKLASN